jgi:hypothetical protein
MQFSIQEKIFLIQRQEELQREIRELKRTHHEPRYHDANDRRLELEDELTRVEAELQESHVE